ncbi:MAG: replication initiator protein A [Rhodomicrobium sp.]
MSLLLPERHPVRDFFVLDVLDVEPRGDMASMEHPIFSLSTKPEQRPLIYEHNGKRVEVVPSGKGLATVFDKDILIYCVSKLVSMRDEGKPIGPCVRLTTHDMLVATNRPTNSLGYERLEPALDRLMGTFIKTSIMTGNKAETKAFSLIQSYDYSRKKHGIFERLQYLEVELSSWLFRGIEANEVLGINRDYFRLRRPIDRRLYELARKHCGKQPSWRVSFDVLQKKVGSHTARTRKFGEYMRHVAAENHLPDYAMTLEGEQAVFWRREQGAASPFKSTLVPAASVVAGLPAPASERRIMVTSQAVERLYEIAPGWDKYLLEHAYIDWAKDKEAARNEDARFISWVGSFTKGKPAP